MPVHSHQTVRIGVRQRIEQHRLADAENGRVRADAEGERQYRKQREEGRAQRRSDSEAEVLSEITEPVAATRGATVRFEKLGAFLTDGREIAQSLVCRL